MDYWEFHFPAGFKWTDLFFYILTIYQKAWNWLLPLEFSLDAQIWIPA